jgi:tungstate transport system ATP-binding protein
LAVLEENEQTSDVKISLRNIWKFYDGNAVLKNINLDVLRGEILSIIGNSGAGKTTLLRIMAFLERAEKGEYIYDGTAVENREVIRQKVTMVFQKPIMFNSSVYANVSYGLKIRGNSRGEIDKKVKRALKAVKLEEHAKRRAKSLSGGEQQRVSLARAIAIDPEVLLLDEPTANLDPGNVQIIENTIKELAKSGTTIVISTHNLFQAKRISERVIHLHDGQIIEISTADKIFSSPESELTKKFISGDIYF